MKGYLSMSLRESENLFLVAPEFSMAEELYQLVDAQKAHLGTFLNFVETVTGPENQTDFLKMKLTGTANGTDRLFIITEGSKIIGTIDLHKIDSLNKKAEIGYWLSGEYTKRKIMTDAAKKICEFSFDTLALNKLIIFADKENVGSNLVAQKAGFSLVGCHREDIIMYGEFRDMNEYELLRSEFQA